MIKRILYLTMLAFSVVVAQAAAQDSYVPNNLIFDGSNKWIVHTPDDGRTQLYLAPIIQGSSNWNWPAQTQFFNNGDVLLSGSLAVGTTTTAPAARFHINEGTPSGVQAFNTATKLAIDSPGGGFSEIRTSADNNTWGGLLFTDNNLGGYVAFHNYPDDRMHMGAYGGIAFEVGTDNSVGGKAERMRIDNNGYVGIGTSSPSTFLNVKSPSSGQLSKFETTNSANSFINVSNGAGSLNVGIASSGSTAGYGYLWSGSGNFMIGNDGNPTLTINGMGNGSVGIGHTPATGYKLSVGGKMLAENVTVKLQTNWPDYVFEKSYSLPSLDQVKSYIDENKHLPEIPSAKEMETNGINLGEMNMLLLKKVEELTLYVIELNKKDSSLQSEVMELRSQIEKLKK